MPSGAKKRKAAKKKLQKAHNNGAHSQANDDPRSHDDRVSDGGDVDNHDEGTKEKRSGEESDGKFESEEQKSSSGSSSGSSSDNEEVVVELEKSVVFESRETESALAVFESLNTEVVVHEETPKSVEILAEDSVSSEISKEESVPIEESGVKQTVEEVLPEFDEKEKISSVITNLPEPVDIIARENETLLPPTSGVPTEKKNGGVDHHVNESEKQALVSSAVVPVRRTSWMDCCGLSEVFSGGSSR